MSELALCDGATVRRMWRKGRTLQMDDTAHKRAKITLRAHCLGATTPRLDYQKKLNN